MIRFVLACALVACARDGPSRSQGPIAEAPVVDERREEMITRDIAARGIADPAVLRAMRRVPRERFVPADKADEAYSDSPLPIGHSQTISQPYIVALMTELARPGPGDRALDVGTGSGYQAAVLSEIVGPVTSMEIVCPLADRARALLAELGYAVEVRCGDGWSGAPDKAPFDVIIVAAAPETVPPALLDQLAIGGRLVIPVGPQRYEGQTLRLIEKQADGSTTSRDVLAVRFVPMTGGGGRDAEP